MPITTFLRNSNGVRIVRARSWKQAEEILTTSPDWSSKGYFPLFGFTPGPKGLPPINRVVITPWQLVRYQLPLKKGFRFIPPQDRRNASAKFYLIHPDNHRVGADSQLAGRMVFPHMRKAYGLATRGKGVRFETTLSSAFKYCAGSQPYDTWLKKVAKGENPFFQLASNTTVYAWKAEIVELQISVYGVVIRCENKESE